MQVVLLLKNGQQHSDVHNKAVIIMKEEVNLTTKVINNVYGFRVPDEDRQTAQGIFFTYLNKQRRESWEERREKWKEGMKGLKETDV